MADTDFTALTATNTIAVNDSMVIMRGGVPYRFSGTLPAVAADGSMTLEGAAIGAGFAGLTVRDAAGGRIRMGYTSASAPAAGIVPAQILCGAVESVGGLMFATRGDVLAGMSWWTRGVAGLTEAMRLSSGGNLIVGAPGGGWHGIYRNVAEGQVVLEVARYGYSGVVVYSVAGSGASPSPTAMLTGKHSTTNRSLSTAGTINASGADYAEYLRKALAYTEWQFAKGQVLGINDDGELTLRWSEAHSFVIKSYDPAYVGGDTWAQHLGARPEAPAEPEILRGSIPAREDDEDGPAFDERLERWKGEWNAAMRAFTAAQAAFESALPLWEAALEEARAAVDRVAFSGQVPVIVEGAYAPGQYLVAHEGADDTIVCRAHDLAELLADPALAYRKVGKVWAVREVKLNPTDDREAPEMVTRAWANVLHS